ncbi:MAG: carboxylating nicotinate-nucleotide diphosphorylase [Candidatus Bathyarchaeota archaeon]|nr:carboxylating nicotinate-nucleotide diphosphorylase [Candidatus Bathyarchaeum tardum]
MWLDVLDRQNLVELAYQKGNKLTLSNEKYLSWLTGFFNREYNDDVYTGDITSNAILTKNKLTTGFLYTKSVGVIAGLAETCWFLKKNGLEVKAHVNDGRKVNKGDLVLTLQGGKKDILSTERICLNVLQRMSGIATETKHLVDSLKKYQTKIAATRKTLLRYLDKKAVFLGGGLTHRFGLWDAILIKDNHLEALKNEGITAYIETALTRASKFLDNIDFVEIEVTSHEEALTAAQTFDVLKMKKPCVIMLDNMNPTLIQETMETLRESNLYDNLLLEASGDITPKNVHEYAKTGVDVVSMGYLTHSVKALDLSLEMTL